MPAGKEKSCLKNGNKRALMQRYYQKYRKAREVWRKKANVGSTQCSLVRESVPKKEKSKSRKGRKKLAKQEKNEERRKEVLYQPLISMPKPKQSIQEKAEIHKKGGGKGRYNREVD